MKKGAIVFGLVFILNIFFSNAAAAATRYCIKNDNSSKKKVVNTTCGDNYKAVNIGDYNKSSAISESATPAPTPPAAVAAPAAAQVTAAPAAAPATTQASNNAKCGNLNLDPGICMARAWYEFGCASGYGQVFGGAISCPSGETCCRIDRVDTESVLAECGNGRGICTPGDWGGLSCPGDGSRVYVGSDCATDRICCEYPDITTVDNRGGATTGSTTGGAAPVMRGVEIPTDTGLSDKSIKQILTGLLQWLLSAVGIIALIGFAISGIQYILAAGDDDMMKAGKKNMVSSIMGIAIVLASLVIIQAIDFALRGMTF